MTTLLKRITGFFFSLRTTMWLLGVLIIMFFAGAYIMPARKEFETIHSVPMLEWLKIQPVSVTWWLWGAIGILALLSVNTLFCSAESIIKKRKVTQWLLLISPQIIHIGFLFMILAHLLSAAGGYQNFAVAMEGNMFRMSDDAVLKIKDIHIQTDDGGYINDWKVGIEYLSKGKELLTETIAPNHPLLLMGFNINVKDLQAYPYKAVLLQISREPGAVWALAGSILFMVGIMTLITLKIRMEK
jgi:cytochrome c biogenesis protein ResB